MKQLHPSYSNKQIYIYCSGKSGSSTLFKTFEKYFHSIQIHSKSFFKYLINRDNLSEYFSDNIFDYIEDSKNIYKDLYFIDSYRLPLERSISSFFQGIDVIDAEFEKKETEYLINMYNNYYYNNEDYFSIDEILEYFKIYDFTELELKNFHKHNYIYKTIQIESTNIHIILLKFNCIEEWEKILSNIFGININLIHDNISLTKKYYEVYKDFKKKYFIYENIIDHFTKNEHFLKYNTEEEQEKYIKYLKKILV